MNYITQYLDFFLHLNTHLPVLIADYGFWVYAVGFIIILLECGFVLTPFLPGESMLFAFGAVAAAAGLNVNIIVVLLIFAAILGGFVNYALGSLIGNKLLAHKRSRFIEKHIKRTEEFYQKHGVMAILLARLVPIIRTFIPFLAGLVKMNFSLFSLFNIIGGIVWISLFCYLGYFFGGLAFVKQHFSWIVILIVIFSLIPLTIEYLKTVRAKKHEPTL